MWGLGFQIRENQGEPQKAAILVVGSRENFMGGPFRKGVVLVIFYIYFLPLY